MVEGVPEPSTQTRAGEGSGHCRAQPTDGSQDVEFHSPGGHMAAGHRQQPGQQGCGLRAPEGGRRAGCWPRGSYEDGYLIKASLGETGSQPPAKALPNPHRGTESRSRGQEVKERAPPRLTFVCSISTSESVSDPDPLEGDLLPRRKETNTMPVPLVLLQRCLQPLQLTARGGGTLHTPGTLRHRIPATRNVACLPD